MTHLLKILFLGLMLLLASCAKESSEADPNLVDVPVGAGAPATDFDVFINQGSAQADPDTDGEITFDIVFSRAINPATFTVADITNSGTATGVEFELVASGNNSSFFLVTSGVATEGTIIPSIAAGLIQDTYSNQNLASKSTDNSVFYDSQLAVVINQKVGQADPASSTPVEFDVTFTSAIDDTTFNTADITQNGTATGITWNIINLGDNINYTLQATAITGGGTVIPTIVAGLVSDAPLLETNIASTSTDNTVTYNAKFDVTINQKGSQNDPASAFPVEFDVVFSEAINPATFKIGDITQNGTATVVVWNIVHVSGNTNFTIQATGLTTEGTIIPSLAADTVQTASAKNNNASTSTDNSVTFRTNFYVTVDQTVAQADPTAALPIEFDVVFDQEIDPSTFTDVDITQNGTATVDSWTITNNGDDTNFTLRATVVSVEGTVQPSIGVGTVQDKDGGANNYASTSADNEVTYDTIFDVTINQKGGQVDPATTLPIEFDVVFSRDIDPTTFMVGDIIESGTATGITWEIINLGDNTNFTLRATASSQGTLVPSLNANSVQDPTGGNNAASTSTDNEVTYGNTFTVTIEQAGAQLDPAGTLNVEFDVVFSEAIDISTFVPGDITQNGDAPGITWNIVHVSGNTNYTLQATAVGGEGTIIPSLGATTVKNLAKDKDNLASTSTDNSVTWMVDFTSTINQGSGQADPSAAFNIVFDVVFETPINTGTFTSADISDAGTAGVTGWTITHVSGNTNYTVEATGASGNGTIIPSIIASGIDALNGATNLASTSTDNSVTYNPTFDVTINQASTQTEDPTATLPIEFDVVFSEATDGVSFDPGDISQGGTATVDTWTVTHVSGNTNYTVRATAISAQGTVIPSITGGTVTSSVGGKTNNLSTSTDNSVEYVTSVGVTINQASGQSDPTNSTPVEFDVVFERDIVPASFDGSDITQNGTATVDTWNVVQVTASTYTVQATAISVTGTVVPSIAAGAVNEVLGSNQNDASTSTDNTVNYYGTPAKLAFAIEPVDSPVSTTMTTFTVQVLDANDNLVANATDSVTIAFGTDPTSGTANIGGTTTKAAVNGIATFDNISIDTGDTGFTFQATSGGLTAATSTSFNITLVPSQLAFITQPSDSNPSTIIAPAIRVEVQDANGAKVASATDNVTLAFQADPSSGGATLGGTLTVAAVSGVATFANITVDLSYADYSLRATASGLTNGVSNVFDILPAAPTNITLVDPASSPNQDSTPTVRVHGVTSGDMVKVFDDSSCTTQVASYTSTGTTVDATTIVLTEGVHNLYANRTVNGSISACSTANLSYEVNGSFTQLDSMDAAGNWSNVGGDDRDWTFGQTGDTPSTDVGPTGAAGGTDYAFTEASNPVNASDEFWLESNTLDGATYPLAFTFNWNKRGDDMGDLIVEASNNNGSTWTQVWSHLGADVATAGSDIWRTQFIDLCTLGYTASNNVKIRIKGIMPAAGTTWNSDIGIDELKVDSGGCVPNPPADVDISSPVAGTDIGILNQSAFTVGGTCSDDGQNVVLSGDVSGTTTCSSGTWSITLDLSSHPDGTITVNADHTSAGGGANGFATRDFIKDANTLQVDNFETLGNWTNAAGDDGDWSLLSGDTPSNNVGPDDDQSGGGQYVYTEASKPTSASDVFILESNSLDAGTYNLKVDFYWNKRGDTMGDIYLEISTNGGSTWEVTPLWSHTGADIPRFGTSTWNNQQVDICGAGYNSGNVMLRFRVVMPGSGSVWHSDIAIDSVKVTVDGCP